jgi:polar amino acid transport system substrate-binding protein
MRMNRSLMVMMLVLGIMAGYVQMAMGAEGTRISPVLDRILSKKEVVVGTEGDMAPFTMTTKDGKIIGLDIDLAHYISGSMEVKLTLKKMRFNDLIPALEAGTVDIVISNMTITPLRNLKVAFVGPYFITGKSLLLKQTNAASMGGIADINKPEKTIVALKGSTSQLFVEKVLPNAKFVPAEDYDQGIAMVREDKAHGMIADFPFCQITSYRYREAGIITLKNPLSAEPLGIAVAANDPLLINWLQNFLNTIGKAGDLGMLVDKWFKDFSWMSQVP